MNTILMIAISAISFSASVHAELIPHAVSDVCENTPRPAAFPMDNPFTPSSAIRETWDPKNFTTLENHDIHHFQLIVNEIDFGHKKYIMDLLEDPERVTTNSRICTSLISDQHTMTYGGRIALILSVPKENIGPMYPDDIASGAIHDYNSAVGVFQSGMKKYPLIPPHAMIESSISNQRYSEIDIMGTNCSTGTQVKVIGIAAECKQWKRVLNGESSHVWNPKTEPDLLDDCMDDYKYPEYVDEVKKLSARYPILLLKMN